MKDFCWICGNTADSREHRYKNSELKRAFPKLSKDQDFLGIALNISFSSGNAYWVKGHDENSQKYPRLICTPCNNTKTQPMDDAYEALSKWCWENPQATFIDLHVVWGNALFRESQLTGSNEE